MKTGKNIIAEMIRMVLLLVAVSMAAFLLITKAPIDPLVSYVGTNSTLSQEAKDEIAEYWGLNDSLPQRYITWANHVLHGDMGVSITYKKPVIDVIKERMAYSFVLMLLAWALSGIFGFIIGVFCGLYQGSIYERIIKICALVLKSAPTFWIGLLILMVFSVQLGWFPIEMAAPAPLKVVTAFQELFTEGLRGSTSNMNLVGHIGVSMLRFFIGYLIAVVSAVVLGLFFGGFPKIFAYVNPLVQLIRPIAPVAWLPFIVLWFGIGDLPAIVIIFIAGFFPILLSTVSAVNHIDETYLKVAKNFGISKGKSVIKIIFPATFPQIMNSLHLALGTSWIFLVSGEMVGAQSGLGFLVMDAKNCIRSDALLATMITIGLIGLLLDAGIKFLEKWICNRFGLGVVSGGKK